MNNKCGQRKFCTKTALYLSAAYCVLGFHLPLAHSAEPFQILETDLTARRPDSAQAKPFQMFASDIAPVQTVQQQITVYQGTGSAGDAEITNNTDEALYFNDQSTASSATIINNTGGETRFNDQSTAASAFITNNADAHLSFNQNSTAADARITNNGGGHLQFNDHATAGSAVITNNGAATFNGNSSTGNALITNNATGTVTFHDQSDAGHRNIYNSGQILFAEQSSAQNSLIDNNKTGSVLFADDSSSASANINNSGSLGFTDNSSAGETVIVNNQTGVVLFDGQASGASSTITNSGTTIFAGHSDAQDARLINNAEADLRFHNDARAGTSMIVNAGNLTFSDKSSAEQSTILTSEGGTTRFQGNADGGSAKVQIDQNATLDIRDMNGRRLTLGTLTSAGDVALGRTVLTADRIVLNESAKLSLVLGYGQLIANDVELQNGKLELQRAADLLYALGETYRIIDAQNLSGSNFADDIAHDFAFVTPLLTDNGTAITLERNNVLFTSAAETANQHAVAGALEQLPPDSLTYRAIISGSQQDARHSFNQLSGEIHASVTGAVHENSNQLRLALLERMRQSAPLGSSRAAPLQSWLMATGTDLRYKGNDNTAPGNWSGYSINGGFDYAITDAFSAGFAGNYEQNRFKVGARSSYADIQTFGAALYAAWDYQNIGLRGGASYQHHALDVTRNLDLPVLTDTLQSNYNGWTGQVFAEAGYHFDAGSLNIEPFAGINYIQSRFSGFDESGLSDAVLSGATATLKSTTASLGVRMNKHFVLSNDILVDARFEAIWNRALGNPSVMRQVAFSNGLPFEITGSGLSNDYLLFNTGLSFWRTDRLSVDILYSRLISSDVKSHKVATSAVLRF